MKRLTVLFLTLAAIAAVSSCSGSGSAGGRQVPVPESVAAAFAEEAPAEAGFVSVRGVSEQWVLYEVNPVYATNIQNLVTTVISNSGPEPLELSVIQWLCFECTPGEGEEIIGATAPAAVTVEAGGEAEVQQVVRIDDCDYVFWWTPETPDTYTIHTMVLNSCQQTVCEAETEVILIQPALVNCRWPAALE